MSNETETIFHRGDRDDDYSNKARRHDDGQSWTVESYDNKTTRAMIEAGAKELPSKIDGKLFQADARQVIQFIAVSSGLNVEFRSRKRRQDSEATKARLAERMREMRQQQSV